MELSCDRCYLGIEDWQPKVTIKGKARHEECHIGMRPADWRDRLSPVIQQPVCWECKKEIVGVKGVVIVRRGKRTWHERCAP